MLKKVLLPNGAIEYVDTNPNIVKAASKKTGRLFKRTFSKIIKAFKPAK
jgi:hypothetical protein